MDLRRTAVMESIMRPFSVLAMARIVAASINGGGACPLQSLLQVLMQRIKGAAGTQTSLFDQWPLLRIDGAQQRLQLHATGMRSIPPGTRVIDRQLLIQLTQDFSDFMFDFSQANSIMLPATAATVLKQLHGARNGRLTPYQSRISTSMIGQAK